MTPEIQNGDYVKNGSNLKEIEHIAELLQNAAIALKTERGTFYSDKNFGSQILSAKSRGADYAAAFARQALSGIDGVYIKSAKIKEDTFEFTIMINNLERQVLIKA